MCNKSSIGNFSHQTQM